MSRLVAALALLALVAAPAAADEWIKETAPELKRLLDRMENTGDHLAHEYKVSLRRADRWLPQGDEAVLWQALETVQKSLNKLENGVDGAHALEIERRMADFFRAWDEAGDAARRARASRSVRRIWDELAADVTQLRVEQRILVERNRRFTRLPEDPWDPARDAARQLSRVELERLRTALLEAEDVSNRLKAALRDRRSGRRGPTPIGAAALGDADLREAAFALERHLDAIVQSWLTDGASTLEPEIEVALTWAARTADRLEAEGSSEQARVAWAELVPPLDELARLYSLEPVAAR